MVKLRVGDKVKLINTEGDNYGIPLSCVLEAVKFPYLTVSRTDYWTNDMSRIWFREVSGYWNAHWFKNINTQLELNFNV